MFVARDKDNSLFLYGFKPTRQIDDTWYDWDDGDRTGIIELDKDLFPMLTWEHEPIEVIVCDTMGDEIMPIADKSNPIKFESCGNHLRNLLTPYQWLIDIVQNYLDGNIAGGDIKDFLKNKNLQEGIDNIIEFSKNDKLENINWR